MYVKPVVLVVDDEQKILQAVADLLEDDYAVVTANSGEEGLHILATRSDISVILCDQRMPKMQGSEFFQHAQTVSDAARILITGYSDITALITVLNSGRICAYIRKPFDVDDLRKAVGDARQEFETKKAHEAESEERRRLNIELEHRVAERTAELQAANQALVIRTKEAEAASQSKADFLANMSHEIRSPLNAVLGLVYLLENSPLDSEALNWVRKLRNAGRLLQSIINDILDFSKIEAGRLEIEQSAFRLDDVLENLANIVGVSVGKKDIELVIGPAPEIDGHLIGDSLRLEQVLINLVSNAIKFTEHGTVAVLTRLIEQGHGVAKIRIAVRDTGIGIAPDKQNLIFSAFAQADASMTRRFGGTGLGLTICQHLVALMGGEIGVSSEPGKGSEFWFAIPFGFAKAPAGVNSDAIHRNAQNFRNTVQAKQRLPGMRVLVVDDSDINCEVARSILVREGAFVSVANDGQAALNWLAEHGQDLDVVLMDVQMPVMDGQEATRRIRRNSLLADLPVIAVTAGVFKDQQKAAQDAGMNGFVAKPLNVNELISAILRLTGRTPEERDEGHDSARTTPTVVEFPGIDVERGLSVWRNMSDYHKILAKFVVDYGACVGSLAAYSARGDHASAKALAHKLKGTAGNLALTGVVQWATEIELSLAEGRDFAPSLDRLRAEFVVVQSSIARLAPTGGRMAPVHRDDMEHAKAVLGDLMRSFGEDSPNHAEHILGDLADLIPPERLSELQARLDDFDFRGAERVTRRLATDLGVALEEGSK